MDAKHLDRKLTAILAADVVGYSRLTGLDEEGTHLQLKEHLRALVHLKIDQYRGRIVKNTGDGLLADFNSAVDAVHCAVDVQRGTRERNTDVPQDQRIEFRIGVNVGDVIIDDDDIYGDGVNVATRLEGIAEAGGICVSSRVQEYVHGKLDVPLDDAGNHMLKNIPDLVRVYRVRLNPVAPVGPGFAIPELTIPLISDQPVNISEKPLLENKLGELLHKQP